MNPRHPTLIAVDLGSNSFHLLVSQWDGHVLKPIERNKQVVQLARGLNAHGQLASDAKARALACLEEFRALIGRYSDARVNVAGTQALRMAARQDGFLEQAEAALGHPIAIISGDEEAELTYRGINFCGNPLWRQHHKLVIDIGGASTEFVIGLDRQLLTSTSLELGCVTLAERCFDKTHVTQAQFDQAYQYSLEKLESIADNYLDCGWQTSIGASGTMGVIAELTENPNTITRPDLKLLIDEMLACGELKGEHDENLKHDVLPAGIAMLQAIFDRLQINELQVAQATLKEGLMVAMIEETADIT